MCSWVSFPSWKPATTHTARRTRPACGWHDIFDCGLLGEAERRKGSGTANWNDGWIPIDQLAEYVIPRLAAASRVRSKHVALTYPSTSNTASKLFESVANDVNKPCLGHLRCPRPRERRDPAADARRIIEIDVELSQPSVER